MKILLKLLGYIILLIGILFLYLLFTTQNLNYLVLGVVFIMVGVLYIVTYNTVLIYQRDKMIDFIEAERLGLTIVTCEYCKQDNILEDQYCRACGEKLEETKREL